MGERLPRKSDFFCENLQHSKGKDRFRLHQVNKIFTTHAADLGSLACFGCQRIGLAPHHRRNTQERTFACLHSKDRISVRPAGQSRGSLSNQVNRLRLFPLLKQDPFAVELNWRGASLQFCNQFRVRDKRRRSLRYRQPP